MLFSNTRLKILRFTQQYRWRSIKSLSFLIISFLLYSLLFHRDKNGQPWDQLNATLNSFDLTAKYWSAIDNEHRYEFEMPTTINIFHHEQRNKIAIYLKVLQNAISIVSLPNSLSVQVINQCSKLKKPALYQHQHALEIIFPKMLRDMAKYSTTQPSLNPLYSRNSSSATAHDDGPLFFYLEAYPYHSVYCTPKSNNKDPHSSREDWTRRDPYWTAVADYLTAIPEWTTSLGVDFIAPASHPQLKPSRRHPFKTNYLQRMSFLCTDFDVAGYAPKDIIVPYLTEPQTSLQGGALKATGASREFLLYFAGNDNPKQGLRSLLQSHINALKESDIYFSLGRERRPASGSSAAESERGEEDYGARMAASRFCLIVRGDTSSSRRLFTAIALGCIPVIISDWGVLPFDSIIDYGQFTFTFPESVATSAALLQDMIHSLRAVPVETLTTIRSRLDEARGMLLFNHLDGAAAGFVPSKELSAPTKASVLNPVVLTLIEALIARIEQCQQQALSKSALCKKIERRMART